MVTLALMLQLKKDLGLAQAYYLPSDTVRPPMGQAWVFPALPNTLSLREVRKFKCRSGRMKGGGPDFGSISLEAAVASEGVNANTRGEKMQTGQGSKVSWAPGPPFTILQDVMHLGWPLSPPEACLIAWVLSEPPASGPGLQNEVSVDGVKSEESQGRISFRSFQKIAI